MEKVEVVIKAAGTGEEAARQSLIFGWQRRGAGGREGDMDQAARPDGL